MMYFAAVIVVLTLIAMASGRVPPVLALATGLCVAGLTGVASSRELLSGLSNGGVVTVAAMLVIAKGVIQTGVVTRVTWQLLSDVETAQQALRRLSFPVGIVSSLINTTPIVAMLIPASRDLEQTRGVPARQVLLPIAHITTLFGSITLIGTSSNLIIAGIARSYGVEMTMFSFAPVALPVALVGTLVIYILTPKFLGGQTDSTPVSAMEWRVEIPVGSHALIATRRASSRGLLATREFELVEISRGEETLPPDSIIRAGDTLVFLSAEDGVGTLWRNPAFGLSPRRLYAMALGPGANGKLGDIEANGSIRVIAARTETRLSDSSLTPGDTLLVTGESSNILQSGEAVALWREAASRSPQPSKTWIAILVLVLVIVSASSGMVAVELAAVSGAVLMVLGGVLRPSSAARALDWNLLGILAGSVGLGAIVVSSGLAQQLAVAITSLSSDSVTGVVVVLVLATAFLTNLTTNAAAAAILTPIGIGLATDLGVDPVIVLATIGTCISFTLINPFSHQSNLMVMRPGGYTNAIFARFGIPLLASVAAGAIVSAAFLIQN